jgi:hypothetical protein
MQFLDLRNKLGQMRFEEVSELIALLHGKRQVSLKEISQEIRTNHPSWLCGPSPDRGALGAVAVAAQLWLFTSINVNQPHRKLGRCIETAVLNVHSSGRKATLQRLSQDFSEESLTNKGGMDIVWTSDLWSI